jgi:quercetin dioxygenase-like cupin family protein
MVDASRPDVIRWDDARMTEVRPGIVGATFQTPQLTVVLYHYDASSSWEEHRHPQDQVTTVLEGMIDFVVDGTPVRLVAGETATLPGGTAHSATVPADGPCRTVNVLTSRQGPPHV